MLGSAAASRLGIDHIYPGERIWVDGQWLYVVGILGSSPLAPEIESAVLVGFKAAERYMHFNGHANTIYVRAQDSEVGAVHSVLAATANPEAPNEVNVSEPSSTLVARADAQSALNGLFLGLGAVALLVGAVGVANIMIISVLERRSEIGLRRALGATRGQIRTQFLSEAVLLALAAGAIGVGLGALATAIYAQAKGWSTVVPTEAWAGGIGAAHPDRRDRRAAARAARGPAVADRGAADGVMTARIRTPAPMPLWPLAEPQDPDFRRLNSSLAFDRAPVAAGHRRLARVTRACSRRAGSSPRRTPQALLEGLDRVEEELREERFEFSEDDEDIHMAIERRLIELTGAVGGRLHTARSRNDQVVTDLAMYVREHADAGDASALLALMDALVERAREHIDWRMPGYTHLQRAQPVYLSHHLLAYFWMFERDARRLRFARHEAARLPLGAGALAGVGFETDRAMVARELGFEDVAQNSMDAVSGRDFALDYLSARRRPARPTSRGSARSSCCGRARSSASASCRTRGASTSSIMPQKKNPDAAELLRAKAPRIVGHLSALHGVLHALPLAYNKDLQEDKEHVFDTVDTLEPALAAARGMIAGVRFDRERLEAAASGEAIAATELADAARAHAGFPSGRRMERSRSSCARRSRSGRVALGAHRRGARRRRRRLCGAHRGGLRAAAPVPRRGSSRRSPRAAPRARGSKSRSRPRRSCSMATATSRRRARARGGLPASFYDAPRARGRARPRGLRGRARGRVRRDRRDRGLPRQRAGVPRVRRAHAAHDARSSARPVAPTCTAPTASTRCSTPCASPRASARRC